MLSVWQVTTSGEADMRATGGKSIYGASVGILMLDARFPRRRLVPEGPMGVLVHLVEEIRWFKKYIEGVEWTPWPVPK